MLHTSCLTGALFFLPCRSHVGQSEPGCADLHRVLGDPSKPGDSPVSGALAGSGRPARRAHASPGCHRKPHGQQHLGELHPGQNQTHTQCNPVSSAHHRLFRGSELFIVGQLVSVHPSTIVKVHSVVWGKTFQSEEKNIYLFALLTLNFFKYYLSEFEFISPNYLVHL